MFSAAEIQFVQEQDDMVSLFRKSDERWPEKPNKSFLSQRAAEFNNQRGPLSFYTAGPCTESYHF